jgi:hypothetical protein
LRCLSSTTRKMLLIDRLQPHGDMALVPACLSTWFRQQQSAGLECMDERWQDILAARQIDQRLPTESRFQ